MEIPNPRYLTPFHPKQIPHFFTDILIIGGGIAGLRAALEVQPEQSALLITKGDITNTSSFHAQGGIAAVVDPTDSFQEHIEDTLAAGAGLCNPEVVESVVREAPHRIEELVAWGAEFDRVNHHFALGREGGHRRNRIVHAKGDATGQEIMRALLNQVQRRPNIEMWDHTYTIDLLTHGGVCRGALVWNRRHGRTLIWAKQTILCTGGAGQLYRETTNPEAVTGDGIAMAYRAGAEVRDLEFVQFHPTVLYIAGSARHLITEAMRGEGAYLVDRYGDRFMFEYDPRGELAPRDIVSLAIVSQMEKTRHPNVYLDLSHLPAEQVRARFPGIAAICRKFDIDITRDRIPVRPGAHYLMGGVTVDTQGRTTLTGLWAAGEVTASGLHGANRLASNSLLEALVFGRRAGRGASNIAAEMPDDFHPVPLTAPRREENGMNLDLVDILNSLKSLMWRNVGLRRDAELLEDALTAMQHWCRYVLSRQFSRPDGWELQNMLQLAYLMTKAALLRTESRGCHIRTDYPNTDDSHWRCHIAFRREQEEPIKIPLVASGIR